MPKMIRVVYNAFHRQQTHNRLFPEHGGDHRYTDVHIFPIDFRTEMAVLRDALSAIAKLDIILIRAITD